MVVQNTFTYIKNDCLKEGLKGQLAYCCRTVCPQGYARVIQTCRQPMFYDSEVDIIINHPGCNYLEYKGYFFAAHTDAYPYVGLLMLKNIIDEVIVPACFSTYQ